MKSTGIVRKVDELGRIVLPVELRRTLNIEVKDSLEIYVENGRIILQKYEPTCADLVSIHSKCICKGCAKHCAALIQ